MIQENKDLQQLYIMDVKTLKIFNVNVTKIDECKFAFFDFNDSKYTFDMRGTNIQTLAPLHGPRKSQYLVSKDIGSFNWLKLSFKWLLNDIRFMLRDTWNKIYDEKFYSDKN